MTVRAPQVLPTPGAAAACEELARLLRRSLPPGDLDDAYFSGDWSALWSDLVRMGWTSIADGPHPGADGELSLRDLAAISETWGAFLIPVPYQETLLARRWMEERPSPDHPTSYALEVGGGLLVPFAHACDAVRVPAGQHRRKVHPADLGRALDVDRFSAALPISRFQAEAGQLGVDASSGFAADAATLAAAQAVGAARAALVRAVAYARVREQFGRPIGSFQAVKHRLADMYCRVELARSAVTWACASPEDAAAATTHALALTLRVAEDAVQVHGGIGFTWECQAHRYLRQVIALRRLATTALQPTAPSGLAAIEPHVAPPLVVGSGARPAGIPETSHPNSDQVR